MSQDKREPTVTEQRGAAEVITTVATVVMAAPAAIQLGSQVKDKLKK